MEALQLLEEYPWPGNIRELENAVVRATAICDGIIRVKDLPERVQQFFKNKSGDSGQDLEAVTSAVAEEWPKLSIIEGRYVAKVLAHTRGNKQAAARLMEIDRKTLDRMIKRHGITSNNGSPLG
jgi:DNA-binding NtrC family response regulator